MRPLALALTLAALGCSAECRRGDQRPCLTLTDLDGLSQCVVTDTEAERWSVCSPFPPCSVLGERRTCDCVAASCAVQLCGPRAGARPDRLYWSACTLVRDAGAD